MADTQKIVEALRNVPENDRIGVLQGIIDADWHLHHLKLDSFDPFDLAIITGATELVGLTQQEKYDFVKGDLVMAIVSDETTPPLLGEGINNWAYNVKIDSFKPDVIKPGQEPPAEDAQFAVQD